MDTKSTDTLGDTAVSRNFRFREMLEKEQARLLERGGQDSSSRSQSRNPDRADLAQAYASRERNLTLSTLEREQLQQVEAALQRLDEGTYGRCAQCGQAINPERLKVLPYATLCIACQRQLEQA